MFERIKKLAGQTAIYGMSSILGRLINFLLVPIHTAALSQSEYGINSHIYALIAFLIVVFVYGMETSFFRFSEKQGADKDKVYTTAFLAIFGSTSFFLLIVVLFFNDIVSILQYTSSPRYIAYLFIILSLDTLSAIPFARLRANNRAVRFVSIKLTLILVNVGLNLFFFKYCPWAIEGQLMGASWIETWYNTSHLLDYIFISNIVASSVMMLMLVPELLGVKWRFDLLTWKQLIVYALPLMIGGLAGIGNEMLDRQFIKYMLPQDIADAQLGIYNAVYKLSIFLVLFNQAFRYAAEPFFFSSEKEKNSKNTFAVVLKYFSLVMAIGYVFIVCYIDIFKHFIDEKFWEGLYILPVLLLANVFLGINTNVSIWYKLCDRTGFGIIITGVGLVFTVALNIWLIPKMGYEGAAYATLVSYGAMMITSYLLGQKYYPINYPVRKILLFIGLSIFAVTLAWKWSNSTFVPQSIVFIGFLLTIVLLERKDLMVLKNRLKQ